MKLKILEGNIIAVAFGEENDFLPRLEETSIEKVEKKFDVTSNLCEEDFGTYRLKISEKKFEVYEDNKAILTSKNECFLQDEKQQGFRFDLGDDEVILGLGQDATGRLNQRDVQRVFWHQNNVQEAPSNATVPFYMSSKGYGVYVATSYPVRFAVGVPNIQPRMAMAELAPTPFDWDEVLWDNKADELSFAVFKDTKFTVYFMFGNFEQIYNSYLKIVGYPGAMPAWSYGYMQCKNRYKSAEELVAISNRFRKENTPCDCIVQDWKWFKEFGDFEWDEEFFANMAKNISLLNENDMQLMLAIHPMIYKNSISYADFKQKGLLCEDGVGEINNFDVFHPDASEIMWNKLEKFYDQGIRGFWTDMGEPKTNLIGSTCSAGERERWHNYYTFYWSKIIYDKQITTKKTRPFILARTMSPGVQKYNTALWSSDIGEWWDMIGVSVVELQNVFLSGQSNWGTDIGGFIRTDDFSPEMYIRWFSFGVFCPLFRAHGSRPANEPWSFGEDAGQILTQLINLRYKLLPYIYIGMIKNSRDGYLFIRPCYVDSPEKDCLSNQYQFMFGDMLISPVVNKGERTKTTYLPLSSDLWFRSSDYRPFKGGCFVEDSSPVGDVVRYIKTDSVIVYDGDPKLHVKDISEHYIVEIYGDGNSIGSIYEDNGVDFKYQENVFNEIQISHNDNKIVIETVNFGYRNDLKDRTLTIRLITESGVRQTAMRYTLGEVLVLSKDDVRFEDVAIQNNIELHAEALCATRNGDIVLNVSVVNNTDFDQFHLVFEKPKYYYYQNSRGGIDKEIKVASFYNESVILLEKQQALPQCEQITVLLQNEQGENICSKKVMIGNGYVKRWKVAVDENTQPQTNISQMMTAATLEHNPWGYVNLLKFLHINKKGMIPWELRDYRGIYSGYGHIAVNLDVLKSGTYNFVIKGDQSYKCYIDETLLHNVEVFTEQSIVTTTLQKGTHRFSADLSFESDHPLTGREFGFSLQIQDKNGVISQEILCF